MHISWFGHSFFKIETKNSLNQEVVVLIDPYQDQKGAVPRNLKADLVLLSRGTEKTIALSGEPVVISAPGEYEIKGVMVYAQTHGPDDQKNGLVFQIETENVALVHLGRLSAAKEKEITDELADKLGAVNVLMVPVGGSDVLNSQQAVSLVNQLEPRLVIPMYFNPPKGNEAYEPVDKFVKLMGQKEMTWLPKLKLSAKDLPKKEETRTVLLEKI